MWSTGRRSQRCTPGMPANCPAWTQARPASLCSSAKENGPISPRIPTGLFILLFNNSTKSCQLLTNLSGEELQRSSNLETSLLYAIPMWIGQTAGEKLKKINNFARKRHPSSSPAVKESEVKGQQGRYRYTVYHPIHRNTRGTICSPSNSHESMDLTTQIQYKLHKANITLSV